MSDDKNLSTPSDDCGSAACAIDLLPPTPGAQPASGTAEHADYHDHGHDHHHHGHEHGPAAPVPQPDSIPEGFLLYHIPAMDCAAEEAEIRHALVGVTEIASLHFQLGARTLMLEAPESSHAAISQRLKRLGMSHQRLTAVRQATARQRWRDNLRMGTALVLAFAAEFAHFASARADAAPVWLYGGMGLALVAIFLAGFGTYQKGWAALRQFKLNINALMTVAVTGAFLIGQWPEAAMVMALYAIAEAIEAHAVDRARHAIGELLDLSPKQAEVLQADGTWQAEDVAQIAVERVVRIKPGERVALDGEIVAGHSALDQSSITGESMPVEKTLGDGVFAGSINQTGELQVRVTALAADSSLARMIHAVEQAQGSRAPTQRFVDRFASIYTPVVFVLALLVAVLLPLLTDHSILAALYKALVLLVIACPCALVISTPVSVVSALARAARSGILIKGGVYLEQARNIRAIALDKTGTITHGKPQLHRWHYLLAAESEAEHLALAYGLAQHSDHPVSKAIAQGVAHRVPEAASPFQNFQALLGQGTQAEHSGTGQRYYLGNVRFLAAQGRLTAAVSEAVARLEQQGLTVTIFADEEQAIGLFAVADSIRPESQAAIAQLQQLGVVTLMLTGDNQHTALAIAAQAGIPPVAVHGNLLPADKLTAIQQLQAEYGVVAMTGDGINDAPALAQADIGLAMGAAGTDIAAETADVLIMNDDLGRIPQLMRLSEQTHRILWQNIALAIGIKLIFLVLAIWGNATIWMAVFADMGASLLVVFNGLRLLVARR